MYYHVHMPHGRHILAKSSLAQAPIKIELQSTHHWQADLWLAELHKY